jgi:hypothetical protein
VPLQRLLSFLAAIGLVASGCGGGGEPSPNESLVTVEVGGDLGLGPVDRIVPGFGVGVWNVSVDGGVATLSERHLVGDEAGAGHRIVVDFTDDLPTVVEVVLTRDDADLGSSDETTGPGTILFQDADPAGVISGEFRPSSGRGFRFWVDTAEDTYVDEPGSGEPFRLRPGGVADSFSFATQFVGVVEDSRCPPDAECVWEGRVVVKLRYVWEGGSEEFELVGFETPQGPIFGDAPRYPATPEPHATRAIVLAGLDGDVATLVWRSSG